MKDYFEGLGDGRAEQGEVWMKKKYCVDVHWDVAKVFYDIEASSPEEAERIVAEQCRKIYCADGKSALRHLAELGFEPCEGYEIAASGTQDAKGTYQFGDL